MYTYSGLPAEFLNSSASKKSSSSLLEYEVSGKRGETGDALEEGSVSVNQMSHGSQIHPLIFTAYLREIMTSTEHRRRHVYLTSNISL